MRLVKTTNKVKIKELGKECVQNRLYIQGRLGKGFLLGGDAEVLTVAYDVNPIGWAIIHPYQPNPDFPILGIYIKEEYRKRNIGRNLVTLTIQNYPGFVKVDDIAWKFFEKIPELRPYLKYPLNSAQEHGFEPEPDLIEVELNV